MAEYSSSPVGLSWIWVIGVLVAAPSAGAQERPAIANRQLVERQASQSRNAWSQAVPSPTRSVLEAEIEADYNGVALNQLLARWSDELHIPIYVESTALEALGVAVDTPITLQVKQIPLRQALRYILKPLQLNYRIDGEVLLVSSAKEINARPTFFVYDLKLISDQQPLAQGLGDVVEQAIRTVEPTEWFDGVWRIHREGSLLIVSCSEMAHGEINLLLARLRLQLGTSSRESASPAAAASNADPFSAPARPLNPVGGNSARPDPFGGSQTTHDPFSNRGSGADPLIDSDAGSNPFGGRGSQSDPFGGSDASSDPFLSEQAAADPFGEESRSHDPFGN